MMRLDVPFQAQRLATLLLIGAALAELGTVAGLLQPVRMPPAQPPAALPPPATARISAIAAQEIARTVERDPFRADRRRPPTAFSAVADNAGGGDPVPAPPAATPLPSLRLVGTALGARALAVLAPPGGAARLVRVGDTIAGLRLRRVGQGMATLVSADTSVTLRLPGSRR